MRCVLPLFALVSLAFAPAPVYRPKRDTTQADLKAIQGTWCRTSLYIGGKRDTEIPGQIRIAITGTHLQFPTPDDAWTIALDAKKSPKLFDYRGATPHTKDIIFRGIYRLEGDTLTICCNKGAQEKDRPTKFESSGETVWLQVFERVKP